MNTSSKLLIASLIVLLAGCSGSAGGTGGGGGSAGGAGGGAATGGGAGGGSGGAGGGAGGGTGGGAGGGGGTLSCMAGTLLTSLGKTRLLVGGSMDDASAAAAPWDVRYQYLSGGIFDGATPCTSCASGCTAAGQSCKNSSAGGCGWWGCFQYDQDPPGFFVRDFVAKAKSAGRIPMFTYYEFLQASGAAEGPSQVMKANDAAFMTRYLADWRFVLQQIGMDKALLHLEPDLWGYAQSFNANPHLIPAKVSSVNATDCAGLEESFAGLGRCMVAMVRKYAPNAKVGLHASSWATGMDLNLNASASADLTAPALKIADYLGECGGGDADYVVVEVLDRDAGYYQTVQGKNFFWDTTNATLPNFTQHFAWTKALSERIHKPLVWWQLPVGNMALPNTAKAYKDERVEYFFAHPDELAKANGAIFAFGAGAGDQTTPSTDNGVLISKVNAYSAAGGQPPCP